MQVFYNVPSVIPAESHVLPPQPASLVPPALSVLLPVHENQLSALPLRPGRLFRSKQQGEKGPGSPGPALELANLAEPQEIPVEGGPAELHSSVLVSP